MIIGLPYDGFYNGNIELMMLNGTYADFREVFVKKVELGKLKQIDLEKYDAEWEAIPLEIRKARRDVVVDDSTPKEVLLQSHEGPIKVMRAKPSNGNNLEKKIQGERVKKARRLPAGALTKDNNPLAKD